MEVCANCHLPKIFEHPICQRILKLQAAARRKAVEECEALVQAGNCKFCGGKLYSGDYVSMPAHVLCVSKISTGSGGRVRNMPPLANEAKAQRVREMRRAGLWKT